MANVGHLYPLTSLQIGDAQSYLSQAYLYFAATSHQFFILVDNQSWRMSNKHSTSTHIRELFAIKYRTSPFKNSRALLRTVSAQYRDNSKSSNDERKKLFKWLSVVDSRRLLRKTAFFSLMDLHRALHGFLVFEVSWKNIRGINYYNELQTDTSVAFEVRSMRRWEFNSVRQACSCISSWFSGTQPETQALQTCLIHLHTRVPLCSASSTEPTSCSNESPFVSANKIEVSPFDEVSDHQLVKEPIEVKKISQTEEESAVESKYKDTLLKFYFNDRDLPFKLKDIITSDLRLLTLLESGLPSWVIFLQSYPLFCKLYRPWMRPLVRTLYVLISLVTCMIGFYDLYKNVPLLKATASHLFGPLFDWIEDWDMISRVRYLGTMLFLQNFEKALKWSVKSARTMKSVVLLITKPFVGPLGEIVEFMAPVWQLISDLGSDLCCFVGDLFGFLLLPFQLLYSFMVTVAALFTPIFNSMWGLCYRSLQLFLAMVNHAASAVSEMWEVFGGVVMMIVNRGSRFVHLSANLAKSKPNSHDVSIWRSLWNDLFSKLFRALRSVLYGVIAFLNSCIRHRHSIYNHLSAYIKQTSGLLTARFENQPYPQPPHVENHLHQDSAKHEHID